MNKLLNISLISLSMMSVQSISFAHDDKVQKNHPSKTTKVKISSEINSFVAKKIRLHHLDPSITTVGKLTFLGGLHLKSKDKRFGGISGMMVSPNGKNLLAVSDRGYWIQSDILYTKEGHLDGLANVKTKKILTTKTKKYDYDAEGMTVNSMQGIVVSFEFNHNLSYYPLKSDYDFESIFNAYPKRMKVPSSLRGLPQNLGIEAITTLKDGRILAISEGTGEEATAKAWVLTDAQSSELKYALKDKFRPTDITKLPNGDLLLLERKLTLHSGFVSQLRKIKRSSIKAGETLTGEIIATLGYPYNVDNMEALTARRNDKGETIIYLISDNNYNKIQRTLMLMFKLN